MQFYWDFIRLNYEEECKVSVEWMLFKNWLSKRLGRPSLLCEQPKWWMSIENVHQLKWVHHRVNKERTNCWGFHSGLRPFEIGANRSWPHSWAWCFPHGGRYGTARVHRRHAARLLKFINHMPRPLWETTTNTHAKQYEMHTNIQKRNMNIIATMHEVPHVKAKAGRKKNIFFFLAWVINAVYSILMTEAGSIQK